MIPITRVGDISVGICSVGLPCCPHGWISIHITGSPTTHADYRKTLRIGDLGASTCPHCPISYAVTGSGVTHAEAIPIHRIGDTHNVPCGPGVVVSGSPTTHSV